MRRRSAASESHSKTRVIFASSERSRRKSRSAAGRAPALPPASFTRSKNDPRLRVALTRRAPAAHRLSRGSPERLPFGCRGLASHVDRRRLRRRHRAFALAPGAPSRLKAILLVPRLPGTGFTGDRLRAEIHLLALYDAGFETTVIGGTAPGEEPRVPLAASVRAVPLTRSRLPFALARALVSGAPLQSALFFGDFRAALKQAGRMDLVVALLLPRLLPHVIGALGEAPLVVDFVDALAEAARQAARHDPAPWRRGYWAVEAPRLARAEARSAEGAAGLLATTPFDAAHLPAGTRAVANGVTLLPPGPAERPPAVAFTGRLMYRPNRLAARRLLREIWPRVRRAVPDARLLVGGADAPGEVRASEGREGVEVVSPVTDMAAFLRRARVVALPVDLGTGTPNKLFEAFEAGAAVVASAGVIAHASSSDARAPARAAATDEEFAREITVYLTDPERAARDGTACRAFAEAHADRRASVAAFAAAYRAAVESA